MFVTLTTTEWQRLGRYVKERRERLRLTQHDVTSLGGPSVATVRNIEAAIHASYRGKTFTQLEDALGWQRGSINDILRGEEPRIREINPEHVKPADAPPPVPSPRTLGDLLVARGVRTPEQLVLSDHYRIEGDALLSRVLDATEFSEDYKNTWLSAYSDMRRAIFEDTEAQRRKKREPRDN